MKISGFFDMDYGGNYIRAVETSENSNIYKVKLINYSEEENE